MTVKQILDIKGNDVATIGPEQTVADAAKLLAERKIGAVVVSASSDKISGILSERDIVRCVTKLGASGLDKPISSIMTSKVQTCAYNHSIDYVMEKMTNGRFRHLPVLEQGQLSGIISIGDVVRRRIEDIEKEAEDIKAYIAG